jgi:hypothetical protein
LDGRAVVFFLDWLFCRYGHRLDSRRCDMTFLFQLFNRLSLLSFEVGLDVLSRWCCGFGWCGRWPSCVLPFSLVASTTVLL